MPENPEGFIHPSAVVDSGAKVHPTCRVWHFAHVRNDVILEEGVSIGKDVYVDKGVVVGKYSRIQNGVSVYNGIDIQPWSFIGPHVIFTNDQRPRAGKIGWKVVRTILKSGCSIGAGAIIRCGVELGDFSMIAAGSIVTKNIPAFHLALGSPAELKSKVCACGDTLIPIEEKSCELVFECCQKNLDKRLLALAKEAAQNV